MFRRLLPKVTDFYDFFERHAATAARAIGELGALFKESSDAAAIARRINEIEHEADTVAHDCIEALHRSFITPIDRDDIHRLITRLDDIVDSIDAAADRFALYEACVTNRDAQDFVGLLARAMSKVDEALRGLRSEKDPKGVIECCREIKRLEHECDTVLRLALARLFKEEKDAITLIKWKEIYEYLETTADSCEDVANLIEGIIMERA